MQMIQCSQMNSKLQHQCICRPYHSLDEAMTTVSRVIEHIIGYISDHLPCQSPVKNTKPPHPTLSTNHLT